MDYTTSHSHGPLSRVHFGESLVVRVYSEIDHIHLSSEAQCVRHLLPQVDCHTIDYNWSTNWTNFLIPKKTHSQKQKLQWQSYNCQAITKGNTLLKQIEFWFKITQWTLTWYSVQCVFSKQVHELHTLFSKCLAHENHTNFPRSLGHQPRPRVILILSNGFESNSQKTLCQDFKWFSYKEFSNGVFCILLPVYQDHLTNLIWRGFRVSYPGSLGEPDEINVHFLWRRVY